MIPERVALGMVDDGWILRNKIVWAKPNHMPSSVKDRLSNGWEVVYFFVKSRRYFFDLDAIREPFSESYLEDGRPPGILRQRLYSYSQDRLAEADDPHLQGRVSKQDSVVDPSTGEPKASYEGFNERWKRSKDDPLTQGEQSLNSDGHSGYFAKDGKPLVNASGKNPGDVWEITTQPFLEAHFATFPEALVEKPIKASCPPKGIVLDPFAGAGTVAKVAKENQRSSISVEIKKEYVEMLKRRIDFGHETIDHGIRWIES